MSTRQLVVGVSALLIVTIAGCGGSSKVSAGSLHARLLPASQVVSLGLGVQRTLDWSDPVNLVGEGMALPAATHPSEAVKQLKDAGLAGSTGEILTKGSPASAEETVVTVGVAKFATAAGAERVRDWMHSQDLEQPCYGQCIFAPRSASIGGIPSLRYVIQSGRVPPPPPGAPRGIKVIAPAPANYLAEFTRGPYLYWSILHANSSAKTSFEQGVRLYYAHIK